MFTFHDSRSIVTGKLFTLMASVNEQAAWPFDSVLLTSGKEVSNMIDHVKNFIDENKTYEIGDAKFKGNHLITLVEKYATEVGAKKFPVIYSGNHRATAILLLHVTGQRTVNDFITKEVEDGTTEALAANMRNSNVAKLERLDSVKQVLNLISEKKIESEADLKDATGCTRYQAIINWQSAELVRLHKCDINEVCTLSQKQLAEVRNNADPAAGIKVALTTVKEKVKALNQKELVELSALAEGKGSLELFGLVEAIRTGGKATAGAMIVDLCEILASKNIAE